MKRFSQAVVVGLFLPAFSFGEFRRIALSFTGLDCASCSEFISSRLARMRGVESAEVDRQAGKVTLLMRPDNRIRLGQVRDLVQQSGFTPGGADVEVRGAIARAGSGWTLRIPETGAGYQLRLPDGFTPEADIVVTVSGTVPPPATSGAPEILEARSVARQ